VCPNGITAAEGDWAPVRKQGFQDMCRTITSNMSLGPFYASWVVWRWGYFTATLHLRILVPYAQKVFTATATKGDEDYVPKYKETTCHKSLKQRRYCMWSDTLKL
jgi:hypothetical protein